MLFTSLLEFAGNSCSHRGWTYILQIVIQCARCSLLPTTMVQLDDFVGGDLAGRPSNRSFKYLYRIDQYLIQQQIKRVSESKQKQQEATLFGAFTKFIDYFTINETDGDRSRVQKERQSLRSAQIILQDYCKINVMIKKSANFNIEAVRALIR